MTGAITAAPMDVAVSDTDAVITFDDRHYRIHGLDKQLNPERLRVRITVSRHDLAHVDTLDLYVARLRKMFIREAAAELYVEAETIKRDVGRLLLKLEELQEERIRNRLPEDEGKPMELTDRERQEALGLLEDPSLIERILADYDRCGLVGEETNKLRQVPGLCLAAAGAAAGRADPEHQRAPARRRCMDATLAFMPPEDQMRVFGADRPGALLHGPTELKHKMLAVSEEEGVAEAAYALKLLQSDGRLTIATAERRATRAGSRPSSYDGRRSGGHAAYHHGRKRPMPNWPAAAWSLQVNEQPEQTAAIHRRQRQAYTLAGSEAEREAIRYRHQNAQRLLKPLGVVIPWAEQLSFRTDQTGMRRDHAKYLALIASITLVHQYQRKQVTRPGDGRRSVVATIEDIRWANRLLSDVAGQPSRRAAAADAATAGPYQRLPPAAECGRERAAREASLYAARAA